MKFSTREDIAAPIDQVFEALTDFEIYERAVLKRGAEVTRVDDLRDKSVGMQWQAQFQFRGRTRIIHAEITELRRPQLFIVESRSAGLQGHMSMELIALSPRETRLFLQFDMRPKSFSARVFIQSLRLSKASLNRRFKNGVTNYARGLEHRLEAQIEMQDNST